MKEFEIRGRGIVDCMSYFSEAMPQEGRFVYGGLFWTGNEEYIKNFSIILHKLINRKERLENLEKELEKVLENPAYKLEGKALYDRYRVIRKKTFEKTDKSIFPRYKKGERMNIVSGKVINSGVDRRSGLVFLRLLGIEGGPVDNNKVFEGRRRLVEIWEKLTQKDHIKEYLAKVRRVGEALYELYPSGQPTKTEVVRLFGYMAGFDFKNFGNSFLLSRAKLFWRKKKAEELVEEIKSSDNSLWEDIVYKLEKIGINEEDFLELLRKSEDENFLKELRMDWKGVLKKLLTEKSEKFLSGFVAKGDNKEGSISYGEFLVPSNEIKLYLFYEDSLKDKIDDFVEGFKRATKVFGKFIGDVKVHIEKNKYPIANLIYKFERLKAKDFQKLKPTDSVELLLSLMNFACRLRSLEERVNRKGEMLGILLLLDTDIRQENGGYSFWDYFSFIYDFFGMPVQTLNRQTINEIIKAAKDKDISKNKHLRGLYKNLFISLLKDYKNLRFDFEGFDLPMELRVYVILEKPSVSFCYTRGSIEKGRKHFLYEIYQIEIKDKTAEVRLVDKRMLLTSGLDVERERFRMWLEEKAQDNKTRFCFITARSWEESYLEELINRSDMSQQIKEKSLYVEYEELPTAYISEKAQEDCFVIYTSEFEKLKAKLGIKDDRYSAVLALKPAEPKKRGEFELNGEAYYHQALQVFSTKGPGWERNEAYLEKKSLFLFTVLALSFYESESFQTPYSKLDLWQKKKTDYISIKRKHSEYILPLNAVLYELVYLVGKIPGEDESQSSES